MRLMLDVVLWREIKRVIELGLALNMCSMLMHHAWISDHIETSCHKWNVYTIDGIFLPSVADIIKEISLSAKQMNNVILWTMITS